MAAVEAVAEAVALAAAAAAGRRKGGRGSRVEGYAHVVEVGPLVWVLGDTGRLREGEVGEGAA